VIIFKVHAVLLFSELVNLAEFVHVELADKRGDMLMPEEVGKHFFLQLLDISDEDLVVSVPGEIVRVLLQLDLLIVTSKI
jgi:hypothetical protein